MDENESLISIRANCMYYLVVHFNKFISIYPNVIYNRVRAVMLDTALQPYTDVADLYVIDPDGYIIRSADHLVYIR